MSIGKNLVHICKEIIYILVKNSNEYWLRNIGGVHSFNKLNYKITHVNINRKTLANILILSRS